MFEKILGHENVKQLLQEDIVNNRISHAYLFSGIEGIGKKKVAIELAKEILNTDNLESCADYKLIQKQEDKKEIIVEQVRNQIVNDVHIKPAMCSYKVYIVDDANLLNIVSQNALLKTLEEPPKHVVIILIANSEEAMLSTILSRVKKINFNSLSKYEILSYIKQKFNKDIDDNIIEYANGSLKKVIDIVCEEENKFSKIETWYKYIEKKDKINAIKEIENINFKNEDVFEYMTFLFMNKREYENIFLIEEARKRMKQNANEDMVKQALNIKLFKERS